MIHFLETYFAHPLRGDGYLFWSGAGSDIGEIAIIGGLITLIRHNNCHVDKCWRRGTHAVDGTPFKVCRTHHPDIAGRVTVERIAKETNGQKSQEP